MRALILIFPRLTVLDFIGPYDPLSRITGMRIDPSFRLTIS